MKMQQAVLLGAGVAITALYVWFSSYYVEAFKTMTTPEYFFKDPPPDWIYRLPTMVALVLQAICITGWAIGLVIKFVSCVIVIAALGICHQLIGPRSQSVRPDSKVE